MRVIWTILLALPLFAQQPPPPFGPALKDVLNLSSDQAQKIGTSFAFYDALRRTANLQMFALNADLAANFAQPSPDPAQIGSDYAEAESIRRNLVAAQSVYRMQVRALLTPAQLAQYQALLNSITLQPLLSEASCAFLENSPFVSPWFNTTTFTAPAVRSGDFLVGPVPGFSPVFLPFIPPAPGPTFCGSPMFPLALREFLNVTDTQVAAIAQASADYNDLYQRRQDRIAQVQLEIRDETAKDQPDPMALGVRYAEISLLSQDLQNQAAQLRQKARASLTGDQAARLKMLDDSAMAQPALSLLQACDLLIVPPGTQPQLLGLISVVTGNPGLPITGSCRVM